MRISSSAQRLHDGGIGFGIIDNDATDLYVVVEVPKAKVTVPIVASDVDALGPDGPIAAMLARYEDRPAQREMASAIATLYNEGGIGLLEAGTGVGKSLGYLLPALRWAAANGERTVVSTNTINLQEQLVGKDLPFLRDALTDQPVRFALLKGWRNYLCLYRLEQASSSAPGLFADGAADGLEEIRAWSERTEDGSLADLATPPKAELWDEVAAESDLCLRLKCAFFDKCFLFAARRVGGAGGCDRRQSSSAAQRSRGAPRAAELGGRRGAPRVSAADRRRGTSSRGCRLVASRHDGDESRAAAAVRAPRAARQGAALRARAQARVAEGSDEHREPRPAAGESRARGAGRARPRDARLRLSRPVSAGVERAGRAAHRERSRRTPMWKAGLAESLGALLRELALLQDGLRLVRERMEANGPPREGVASLLSEIRGVARRLESAGDALQRALVPAPGDETSLVRWLEVRGRDRNVAATAVPLDIAPILREDLFKRVTTAVITSATLASGDRFAFVRAQLGLDDDTLDATSAVFPSPFDYPRQALLAVPDRLSRAERRSCRASPVRGRRHDRSRDASDGGLFALFTSHRDVREVARELRARGVSDRWPLIVHGEEPRDVLLRRFRESGRAILLGTASFWEGVDVAGEALRGLVIAKLPFRVPTEPLTAARSEAIEARGGDSFKELMLPHATLRLKQGFGRLIRTGTDRGVVVLCDPRASTKAYGRGILAALPPARRLIAPWNVVLRELQEFYVSPESV